MENRVGDQVPDQAEALKLVKQIEDVSAKTEKYSVHLTPEERQKALKMPGGGEDVARLVASLLRKHEVSLPGVDADDIEADLLLAARLRPVAQAHETAQRLAQDGILEAESEAWSATTAGYTALVRLSGGNAKLLADLKPAMDFFGVGRKRKPRASAPK
jgi:hypothetical protein